MNDANGYRGSFAGAGAGDKHVLGLVVMVTRHTFSVYEKCTELYLFKV